jgi:hypothetical protein
MVCMPLFIASCRLRQFPKLDLIAAFWYVMAAVMLLNTACAQEMPSEVQASHLLNFGKFMRHSDGPTHHATFDICILGRDTIGQTIDAMASKESIDHRPVRVPRIADVTDAKGCEIVFVSVYEGERIREDMAILAGTNVLTVSGIPDFLQRGGMIQFVQVDNHVRFAVNLTALNRSHIALSSELLKVAVSVQGKATAEVGP